MCYKMDRATFISGTNLFSFGQEGARHKRLMGKVTPYFRFEHNSIQKFVNKTQLSLTNCPFFKVCPKAKVLFCILAENTNELGFIGLVSRSILSLLNRFQIHFRSHFCVNRSNTLPFWDIFLID